MTTRPDLRPAGLEHLLAALRAAGLPVGAHEVLRLHRAFALAPGLGQDRPPERQLRDLLAAALTHDPAERRLFDEVYEPWAERWDGWARRRSELALPSPDVGEPGVAAQRRPRRRPWRPAALLLSLAAIALLLSEGGERGQLPGTADRPGNVLELSEPPLPIPAAEPKPVRTVWLPRLQVIDAGTSIWRPDWPALGIGVLALAAAALAGWRYRRRSWIPAVLDDPLPGPARLPLLPQPAAGPELLDAGGAETLIWGVDRHVTERLTPELDLEATARETARAGGIPELRYEPERRLREVWLWLDGMVEDPALERWAEEVAGSLERSGLPVRIGGFDGVPDELLWDEGQSLRPIEVEGHRETALVAICTDGEVLLRQLEEERGNLRPLLASLGAWQRLAVVDFSRRREVLAPALGACGLAVVAPEELPAFFGLGAARPAAPAPADPGEVRAWRAALALGGRPIDRPTAFAARRALGLELSPWSIHRLAEGEPGDPARPARRGGRWMWGDEGRDTLVGWLAEGSFDESSGIREGSLLERALDFWQGRLASEAERRAVRAAVEPWTEHPAERHLRMERALLRLWREPRPAAEELYELGSGELGEALAARLGRLAPCDCSRGDGLVPLPWRLADLDDRSLYLLAERGLGGVRRGALARSGRLVLGLAALAGVALPLLGTGIIGRRDTAGVAPRIVHAGEEQPSEPIVETRLEGGRWQVRARGADGPESVPMLVGDAAVVEVTWQTMPFVELEGGTFRMGSEVDDSQAYSAERPAHEVMVGELWMGETEVTNAQYRVFKTDHAAGDADDLPAVNVSWNEARDYCRSLGKSEDWEYDLPTEAEWEYSARAGTTSSWSFGDDEELLSRHGWYGEEVEIREVGDRIEVMGQAHPVRRLQPNPWGLYDVHGNVWEWVLDCWDEDAYRKRARDTPISDPGLEAGSCHQDDKSPGALRVVRGGAFNFGPWNLRSAIRDWGGPVLSDGSIGFRCIRRARRQP